jgi:hypothetical protein
MASTHSPIVDQRAGLPETKAFSESVSSAEFNEKMLQDPQDIMPEDGGKEKGGGENEAAIDTKENFTACLQVVGAFFLMFNTW